MPPSRRARLGEAETLAAQGRLTPQDQAQIESELSATENNFDASIASLSQQQGSALAVATAQSSLQATLAAHAQVLASLSEAVPASRPALAPILATVALRASGAAQAREIADKVVAADSSDVEAAAEAQKDAAENSVTDIRTLAAATASTTAGPVLSQEADTGAYSAEQAIAEGDDQLQRSDYGERSAHSRLR